MAERYNYNNCKEICISNGAKDLIKVYKDKKHHIKQRLKEFENIHKSDDENVFSELCFCLLTPQSKAVYCGQAIKELKRSRLLFNGGKRAVRSKLQKARFPNNKTAYLIGARNIFKHGKRIEIKKILDINDTFRVREWLVKNVKGLGYKEASHFLRNIGLGRNMSILDVHILKNLKRYKVIKEIPRAITKKTYLEIESKMRKFSDSLNIPVEELDLLFWSNQTGFIFK